MSETLGQRLRRLRHARGLILNDVSAAAALSVSHLNDLEHDRGKPSLDALVRIAAALDLTVVGLLAELPPFDEA